jgi:hypothetical protein
MLGRCLALCCILACVAPPSLAAEKARSEPGPDRPTEADLDKPGEEPATVPAPVAVPDDPNAKAKPDKAEGHLPFRKPDARPSHAFPCRITYSDGTVVEGFTWHRANAPARVFNRAKRAHEDFPLADLARITVRPETENFERDWRWKNQGSSEKVFLDIGYFWNQYITTFTTKAGEQPSGDCNAQFYLQTLDGQRSSWFLFKRQSGRDHPHKKREELDPLVYVKTVEFTDDILKPKPDAKGAPDAKGKADPKAPPVGEPPAKDAPKTKETAR